MPRKKSVKRTVDRFISSTDEIIEWAEDSIFYAEGDKYQSWANEYAILRLYRVFERLILEVLIGAINNDTTTLTRSTGIQFPKHLTDEVCVYLIHGDGYFDFRGHSGLIKTVKRFVPDDHYLVAILRDDRYRSAIDQLSALRNFAAHESRPSKKTALSATGQRRMGGAGSWVKRQGRFSSIASELKHLANRVGESAPY